jgi:hypothetical protein
MLLSNYLPSAQFALVVSSIALAGGLVLAADYFTSAPEPRDSVVASDNPAGVEAMDWQKALAEIQGEKKLAEPIDPAVFATLKSQATAPTLTGTVGRSLLLNLSEAKSQGLGSDFPTQERLVEQATAQAEIARGNPAYSSADLSTVPETEESLKAYGNTLMAALTAYPKTAREETLLVVGEAVDTGKSSTLSKLTPIETEYRALTAHILALQVPATLVPLHLQIVNNFARMTSLYADLKVALADPMRGIGALNLYASLVDETGRLLTSLARMFDENGILFASDEPGTHWSLLLTLDDL